MAFLLSSFFIKLDSGNNDKNERSLDLPSEAFYPIRHTVLAYF